MVIFCIGEKYVPQSLIDFENRIRTNLEQPTLDKLAQRGTTALEELAMQNKKSLQIKQISRTKYYLPTSLISLTMLTSILYQHLTMQMRRDVSPSCYFILAYCTILRYTTHPIMKIGISWEPWRTKLAAAALQLFFYFIFRKTLQEKRAARVGTAVGRHKGRNSKGAQYGSTFRS